MTSDPLPPPPPPQKKKKTNSAWFHTSSTKSQIVGCAQIDIESRKIEEQHKDIDVSEAKVK